MIILYRNTKNNFITKIKRKYLIIMFMLLDIFRYFPKDIEKGYDRSIENFIRIVTQKGTSYLN